MKTPLFFVACGSLAFCVVAGSAQAQIFSRPRAEPKLPDIPPAVTAPGNDAWAKSQQEAADRFNNRSKEGLMPPLNLKPPTFTEKDWALRTPGSPLQQRGAPAKQYDPGTGGRTSGAANASAQGLAPPMAQPPMPERKPQAKVVPAAPEKPPCVYKAVMSDEDLKACR